MATSISHSIRSAYLRVSSAVGAVPLGILMSLLVATGIAWGLTLYQAVTMSVPMDAAVVGAVAAEGMEGMAMGGMSAAGWSVAGLAVFLAVWTVMMAAMMLPAALPMILTFASVQARRERDVAVSTWTFVTGYLLVWAAAGLLVYVLVQVTTGLMTYLGSLDRGVWAPLALGATLVVAGVYQFTPLKRLCLRHCRSPLGFVAQHWRDGRVGALEMGIRHGLYCLGCCWALFAVLIAAGIMSIAWMLLITSIVFAEKVLPHGLRLSTVLGAAFIGCGIIVAIDASWTPGTVM